MDSLKQSISDMNTEFNQRMMEFQKELQKTSHPPASTSPTSKLASDFEAFRSFVCKALQSLQAQVNLLTNIQDQLEMRSRRKMLLIHGIAEHDKEDITAVVAKIISDDINVPDVDKDAFSRCHRLGHQRSKNPRPVLVKFCDIRVRNSVWFSKSCLKDSGYTISEFLTKSRHDTFMSARKRLGVTKCWTRDGQIFLIDSSNTRHRITCMSELDAIISCPNPENSSSAAGTSQDAEKNKKTIPNARSKRIPKAR
ncbi:unnamed protein product [Colias eurytheme]|nr:unnamed protein product [Colias eurytheme]